MYRICVPAAEGGLGRLMADCLSENICRQALCQELECRSESRADLSVTEFAPKTSPYDLESVAQKISSGDNGSLAVKAH